jgi:hypothetical protein
MVGTKTIKWIWLVFFIVGIIIGYKKVFSKKEIVNSMNYDDSECGA